MSLAARISSNPASASYAARLASPVSSCKRHVPVLIQWKTISAITRRRQAKAERAGLRKSHPAEPSSNRLARPAEAPLETLKTPLSECECTRLSGTKSDAHTVSTAPPTPHEAVRIWNYSSQKSYVHPQSRAPPVPHEVFRTRLRTAKSEGNARRIITQQLRHCLRATDVLRVVAVAQQRPTGLQHLATLEEPLITAMYQIRATASDPVVLQTLTAIIARFRCANLWVSQTLLGLGLKFAARSRSLNGMKRYLGWFRSSGFTMNDDLFRAIVAKCSIGRNGYGEIRNGRWQQSDLLQVLQGFYDCAHLPPEKQFHLESFMDRRSWHRILGWVALLAYCKQSEAVWREWGSWRQTAAGCTPSQLLPSGHPSLQSISTPVATPPNRDLWFLKQLLKTGDGRLSWELLRQANLNFVALPTDMKDGLLDQIQYCPGELWSQALANELLAKCLRDLDAMEAILDVRWDSDSEAAATATAQDLRQRSWQAVEIEGNTGHHERLEDMEVNLER